MKRHLKTLMLATRLAALLLAGASLGIPAVAAAEPSDFSAAERLLFTTRHLDKLRLPATLRYTFRQSGSLEAAFDDKAVLLVSALDAGGCCKAKGEFLSGSRQLSLPEIEGADGNPMVLYFLENDLRTMQRLTKGSQTYFRKRIRMALFNGATLRPVKLNYQGREIEGQEILVLPYLDDANAARFPKYLRKQYRFVLSPAVPGGLYGIQTTVGGDIADPAPLIQQELLIEGAAGFAAKASS